ncbi:MAG: ABC transporter permease [Rhodospirillales bacterium]|nr:MAG: ABC transporter permease [Rhodospirillales bacterium]
MPDVEHREARSASLRVQLRVVHALLLREINTRFGQYRFGYVWAVAEPITHVVVLSFIFGIRSRTAAEGVEFPIFLATGIIPFVAFRNMVTRTMATVEANRALYTYPQVRPFDTLIARFVLEVVIYSLVFVLFMVGAGWVGFDVAVQDPLVVLVVFLALGLLGLGVGALACVLNDVLPDVAQMVPIILRPLYFISGIFFSVEVIPAEYRVWLLWNPVLHALELIRGHYFDAIEAHYGDPLYLAAWTFACLSFGLLTFHVYRNRLVAS